MHGENDNRNNNGIDIGKTAVAIEYVPGEAAPKILATGKGVIADKIIERAKESNVPTYKDDKLADTLSGLGIVASTTGEEVSNTARDTCFC